ncbi:MAG: hypothetical protein HC771_03730 [Synechococcales cyanobacterium CRU_2_2]|nr:hypothetical protein [Synechococcales cyanobacterium CRU_2_2]
MTLADGSIANVKMQMLGYHYPIEKQYGGLDATNDFGEKVARTTQLGVAAAQNTSIKSADAFAKLYRIPAMAMAIFGRSHPILHLASIAHVFDLCSASSLQSGSSPSI